MVCRHMLFFKTLSNTSHFTHNTHTHTHTHTRAHTHARTHTAEDNRVTRTFKMRKSHLILSLLTQCADWTLGQKVDNVAGVEDYSDEDASGFTKFMVVDLR